MPRPRKRLTELLIKTAAESTTKDPCSKKLYISFLRSPKNFVGSEFVEGVELTVNKFKSSSNVPYEVEKNPVIYCWYFFVTNFSFYWKYRNRSLNRLIKQNISLLNWFLKVLAIKVVLLILKSLFIAQIALEIPEFLPVNEI